MDDDKDLKLIEDLATKINSGSCESILAALYREMLLGLGLSPSMFSRKLTTFCEKVVDVLDAPTYKYRAYVKAKETHILGRLLNNRFTIDTLIIGIRLLGIPSIKLVIGFEDDKGTTVRKIESDVLSTEVTVVKDKKITAKGNEYLYNFMTKIISDLGYTFEEVYDKFKIHYKHLTTTKSGQCFITNTARDYNSKRIGWQVFYRILTVFGYRRCSLYLILNHANKKCTMYKKTFTLT